MVPADLPRDDLGCTQETTKDGINQHVEIKIDSLTSGIRNSVASVCNELPIIFDRQQLYVLFNPLLGCDSRVDHTVARSVYPVFKNELEDLMLCLQDKIICMLEPTIRDLLKSRETAIFDSIHIQNRTMQNSIEEVSLLRKQLIHLQAAYRLLEEQKDKMFAEKTKEIQLLREQLMQKGRIGAIYKPDHMDGQSKQSDEKTTWSKKEVDDLLKDMHDKYSEERKRLELKQKAERDLFNQSKRDMEAKWAADRERLEQLQSAYDQLQKDMQKKMDTALHDAQEANYDLQYRLQQADAALKATIDDYEHQLKDKDALISRLEKELADLLQKIRDLEAELDKLRKLAAQLQNDNVKKSSENQVDPALVADYLLKLEQASRDLIDLQKKYDDALQLNKHLEEAIKLLKDELDRLKKQLTDQVPSITDDTEFQKLIREAKQQYRDLQTTTANMIDSMFNLQKGSVTKLVSKNNVSTPYEQLRVDLQKSKLESVAMIQLPESMQLLQKWSEMYGKSMTTGGKVIKPGFDIVDSQRDIHIESATYQPNNENMVSVNSVILDERQQVTVRQATPTTGVSAYEIGINTSICASVEDGPITDRIMVDKSIMYECSGCSRSRASSAASHVPSRVGSAMDRASTERGLAVQSNPRPPSGRTEGFKELSCADQSINQGGDGESRNVSRLDVYVENGEYAGSLNVQQSSHPPSAHEVSCPRCGSAHGSSIGGSAIRGPSADNKQHKGLISDASEEEVEYLVKGDQTITSTNMRPQSGQRPTSSSNQTLNKNQQLNINQLQSAQTDPTVQSDIQVAQINGKSTAVFSCPFCHRSAVLGQLDEGVARNFPQFIYSTDPVTVPTNRSNQRVQSAMNNATQRPELNMKYERFRSAGAKPTTQCDTTGVFERLMQKAREIEQRLNRKRDLILEERRRTTERVLRALSLYVEAYPQQNGAFSLYKPKSIQDKSLIQQRSDQLVYNKVIQPQSQHNSYQPFQASGQVQTSGIKISWGQQGQQRVQSGRPGSSVQSTKMPIISRPTSHRQDSVLQLLAASGVLKK